MELSPILACGSMGFTAGTLALLYSIIGVWVVGCALTAINPVLILFLDASTSAKVNHISILAIYVVGGLALLTCNLNLTQSQAWFIPVFGVPMMPIGHFFILLWTRKRIRLKKRIAQ